MAATDPQAAANYVTGLPVGDSQNKAAISVVNQWMQSDPQAASTWAAGFTGSTRQQALNTVVQQWAQNDPAAAGQWLAALPEDSAKQSAEQSYVNNLSWQYPDMAAPVALALTDENQRNNAIQNIARNWLRSDPTAAANWLQTTALPENQKQSLLNSVKK